jgi:hypothetical protein
MEDLIQQCQRYGHKYEEIKKQFFAFHEAVTSQLFDRKIPSLAIRHIKPDNGFYVEFVGKEYLLRYEFDVRDNDDGTGFFVSYLIDHPHTDGALILKSMKQIEVDRSGNARIKGHTDAYQWHCDADGLTILLTLLT